MHICVTRPQWVKFTYLYDERPIFWTCRKHLLAIDGISRKLGSMIHRGVAELGSVLTTQHTEGKFTHIHHRSHDMTRKATGSGPNGLHFTVFCATFIRHFWFYPLWCMLSDIPNLFPDVLILNVFNQKIAQNTEKNQISQLECPQGLTQAVHNSLHAHLAESSNFFSVHLAINLKQRTWYSMFYPLWPRDTLWHKWNESSLVQVITCCMFGTKLSPQSMLTFSFAIGLLEKSEIWMKI